MLQYGVRFGAVPRGLRDVLPPLTPARHSLNHHHVLSVVCRILAPEVHSLELLVLAVAEEHHAHPRGGPGGLDKVSMST